MKSALRGAMPAGTPGQLRTARPGRRAGGKTGNRLFLAAAGQRR
jgi:hypothetical protein